MKDAIVDPEIIKEMEESEKKKAIKVPAVDNQLPDVASTLTNWLLPKEGSQAGKK